MGLIYLILPQYTLVEQTKENRLGVAYSVYVRVQNEIKFRKSQGQTPYGRPGGRGDGRIILKCSLKLQYIFI